jgi:hypothetical protein
MSDNKNTVFTPFFINEVYDSRPDTSQPDVVL